MSAMTQPRVQAAVSAVGSPSLVWDDDVLNDLLALQYVRAVVFTDGKGRTVHINRRAPTPDGLTKAVDLALAALNQMGVALQLGRIDLSACVYQDGVVIVAGAGKLRVAVLTTAGANLGALLNHTRRIFRHQETP